MLASDDNHTITEAVVSAVADAEGVSPLELPPLATVIDPDALESFVSGTAGRPGTSSRTVEFRYIDYTVAIDENGDVTVDELPAE